MERKKKSQNHMRVRHFVSSVRHIYVPVGSTHMEVTEPVDWLIATASPFHANFAREVDDTTCSQTHEKSSSSNSPIKRKNETIVHGWTVESTSIIIRANEAFLVPRVAMPFHHREVSVCAGLMATSVRFLPSTRNTPSARLCRKLCICHLDFATEVPELC